MFVLRLGTSARRRIILVSSVCALVAFMLTIPSSQAGSESDCDTVKGTLRERVISTNPVQSRGRLTGDIHGKYAFELTGVSPSQTPDVGHFDGRSHVQTEDGEIFFTDAGAVSSVGRGNLAYLSTISSGSGEWEGATGQLLFRGFVDPVTGRGVSDYVGEVCQQDD
jgi:hypothetical protein